MKKSLHPSYKEDHLQILYDYEFAEFLSFVKKDDQKYST